MKQTHNAQLQYKPCVRMLINFFNKISFRSETQHFLCLAENLVNLFSISVHV